LLEGANSISSKSVNVLMADQGQDVVEIIEENGM
jgi:hypothetical protein